MSKSAVCEKQIYMNREISWLKFNERVLEEAESDKNPLCERLSFVSIYQSNLDEFFMVRVGSLIDQMLLDKNIRENKTDMTAGEQLDAVLDRVHTLNERQDIVYGKLMGRLEEHNIRIVNFRNIGKRENEHLEEYFNSEIAPFLSPVIVGERQPFPFLKNKDIYTDLSLMTADSIIGKNANDVFNALASDTTVKASEALLVAPNCLQNRVIEMIDEQIAMAKNGEEAYIGVKINSLTDKTIIDELIKASKAGVKIELAVRGICCLIPGVQGETDNIKVISVVGRFLEHSRIYIFGRGEAAKIYIASADFMTRNTLRRVEVAAPVYDDSIREQIVFMFDTIMSDNVQARKLGSNGNYIRVENDGEKVNSQELFYERAYEQAKTAELIGGK